MLSAVLLLYGLTVAIDSGSSLAGHFWWMIALCVLLMVMLAPVLTRYVLLLIRNGSSGVFDSQIAWRLSGVFTLVAMLPDVFLSDISAQSINDMISSWFGNDTHETPERSLNLSKSALNLAVDSVVSSTTPMQVGLVGASSLDNDLARILEEDAKRGEFAQLVLYDAERGKFEKSINPLKLNQPAIGAQDRKLLLQPGSVRGLENIGNILHAQGWLSLDEYRGQDYALFFHQSILKNAVEDAALIESAWARYAELSYTKKGLQIFFLVTLPAAVPLTILSALVMAPYSARRFIKPALSLAEGTKAVAQGDFIQRRSILRNDEFGRPTHLLNHMTEQLAIAKEADERSHLQWEAARHCLECVSESLATGVITLDPAGRLKTFNKAAERILGVPLAPPSGNAWQGWNGQLPQRTILAEAFAVVTETAGGNKPVQVGYAAPDDARILLGKTTELSDDNNNDPVIVVDDITVLVWARKETAWGEVAKRLAHEIRSPLVPIQLSAERLAWELHDKLDEQSAHILTRSTDTIVKQVAVLKEVVKAFRNYIRVPSLNLEKHDLNCLIEETLPLHEGSARTSTAKLSKILLWIAVDTIAMRQALHNILRNVAEITESDGQPSVTVATRQTEDGAGAVLAVYNNGKSLSKEILRDAFEPCAANKPTDTGLGLPVIKKIVEEHGGRISLNNRPDNGVCARTALPRLIEAYMQQ